MIWSMVPWPASRSPPEIDAVTGASVSRSAIRGISAAPALLRRAGRQPSGRLGHPAGGEPQRVPGVAQPHGPAQRGVAVAADPERDVPAR